MRALEGGLAKSPQMRAPDRRIWIAVAAAGATAVLLAALDLRSPRSPSPQAQAPAPVTSFENGAPVSPVTPTASEDVVLAGDARAAGRPLRVGDALPGGAPIRIKGGATVRTGPATLELSDGSQLVWMVERSTALLHADRVAVAVEPQRRQTFRLSTDRFTVEVVGTRFTVTQDEVRVLAGQVRILDLEGLVLRSLGPGEVWRPSQGGSAPGRRVAHRDGVADHLASARGYLAAREVSGARRELSMALALAPTRRQEADAATMAAECAFVEGEVDAAVRLYLAVVERFGELAAAESALFAAARLSDRTGQRDRARTLLVRYLDRYPHGQFQREARSRLHRIERETR